MRNNSKLHIAKTAKADVFFTSASAVESELQYYTQYFRDAVIFMNCNDIIDETKYSAFWNYFRDNHDKIRFKEIIATHYNPDGPSFGLRYDGMTETRFELQGHGEFDDEECIELLKKSDIVVTNPPFSRFSHGYVDTLLRHQKKFLIIGSLMAITYKEFFPLLKSGKVWLGHNAHSGMLFQMSDEYEVINDKSVKIGPNGEKFIKLSNVTWYTNVGSVPPRKPLNLTKTYYGHENEYPKYDNYDAINVDRCKEIPKDYYGVMGVPISFFCVYNPEQFEVIGAMTTTKAEGDNLGYPYIRRNKCPARVIIKRSVLTNTS